MSQREVGVLDPVAIRDVWPTEPGHFTPWLQAHIGELDNVLGLGLTNPQLAGCSQSAAVLFVLVPLGTVPAPRSRCCRGAER